MRKYTEIMVAIIMIRNIKNLTFVKSKKNTTQKETHNNLIISYLLQI